MKKFKLELIISYAPEGVKYIPDYDVNISTRVDSLTEYKKIFDKVKDSAFSIFPLAVIENPKTDIDAQDAYDEKYPEHFKCYFSFESADKKLPKEEITITLWGFDLNKLCEDFETKINKFIWGELWEKDMDSYLIVPRLIL